MATNAFNLEAGGTATYFLQKFWLFPIRRITWFLHDHVLSKVLGSGANNDDLPLLPPLPPIGVRKAIEHHEATNGEALVIAATAESADPHNGSSSN